MTTVKTNGVQTNGKTAEILAAPLLDATIQKRLKAPFPSSWVGWKAQSTNRDKTRALAVAYIDARAVMARLDAVVGPGHWSDAYRVIRDDTYIVRDGDGKERRVREVEVECRLTVLGVTKVDVGSGEDAKAAYSDAFKRAAVKFGIGRYLYSLPKQWVDYDARTRQIVTPPPLPDWALPANERGQQ